MVQLTIYVLEGCGPFEVTKRFFDQHKISYTFVDVKHNQAARRDVASRLETPTSGVVLEVHGTGDKPELTVMQAVSLLNLR
ncbi:MAG: glutaredoxin domain-containing protein [Deinococcota bacterium]